MCLFVIVIDILNSCKGIPTTVISERTKFNSVLKNGNENKNFVPGGGGGGAKSEHAKFTMNGFVQIFIAPMLNELTMLNLLQIVLFKYLLFLNICALSWGEGFAFFFQNLRENNFHCSAQLKHSYRMAVVRHMEC